MVPSGSKIQWRPEEYCLASPGLYPSVAGIAYNCVCRKELTKPGFFLLDLGAAASSQLLRRWMVELERRMQRIHQSQAGRNLVFQSVGRFDQQVTTKLHRDGGPEESFLMLGYEPTEIASRLLIADYSRCAFDLGLTPGEFLQRHNPMFAAGESLLERYLTPVECYAHRNYQILLINNSVAPFDPADHWQGVLHAAAIDNPSEAQRRVVNSTMVASVPLGDAEPVSADELQDFLDTTVVRRRGYDKAHMNDDV